MHGMRPLVVSGSVYGEIASWYNMDVEAVATGVRGPRFEWALQGMQIEGQCIYYYFLIVVWALRLFEVFLLTDIGQPRIEK
jgi:hypothetical protein